LGTTYVVLDVTGLRIRSGITMGTLMGGGGECADDDDADASCAISKKIYENNIAETIVMSNSVRRIFLNAYLAYDNDPGESLQDFTADFDERIESPEDVNLGNFSLNFTPSEPNIPSYESVIDISYDGVSAKYSLPTDLIYTGITGAGSGTTLIEELNKGFKATFGGIYEPWQYESDRVRLGFVPETGKAVEFNYLTTTAARRLGLTVDQGSIIITAPDLIIMTNQPILSRTQCIYLTTDMVSDSITNARGSNHDIMCMVPIYNAEYGSLINYSPSYDYGKLSSPRSFTNLRFRILDDLFQGMRFTSNTNMLASLYISYPDHDRGNSGQLRQPTFG